MIVCAKHFVSKKKKKLKALIESYSTLTSGHRQEGVQSVRDSGMCQSIKENLRELERKKFDHINFSNDNGQFIKESQRLWKDVTP